MINNFWRGLKKFGGTGYRKSFSPPYIQTDRKNARPFISISKSEWNEGHDNFFTLGEYDNKGVLFAKKLLYSEKEI